MPVITLFGGTYCNQVEVVKEVQAKTGYHRITDKDLVKVASRLSGITENMIPYIFSAKRPIFDCSGRGKKRFIVYLKLALAEALLKDHLLIDGFSGQLIPKGITHVLRVCLIAGKKFRIACATKYSDGSKRDAAKRIVRQDEDRAFWMLALFENKDPWDEFLYDIILPMDKTRIPEAASIISENARKKVILPNNRSRKAAIDFLLAARVEETLINEGHFVGVDVIDGAVTLTINKHVMRLGKLQAELMEIADRVDGVVSVETKLGKGYYQCDVYRKYDFTLPSKILLVDDDREFVQTLSERLVSCDI